MKFSLRQLMIFVTISALVIGVIGYSFNRIQIEHRRAELALMEAIRNQQMAEEQAKVAEAMEAKLAELQQSPQPEFNYSILHWNVESGGNDPATIVEQLMDLGRYDIVGLSEVADPEPYQVEISKSWNDLYCDYGFVLGNTGINSGRANDRLLLIYDKIRFELVESAELQGANGVAFNDGRHRAPLYARLKDTTNGQELIVILNHLARGDAEFRALQAGALREWARSKSEPIIAIGDYGFDYDFHTKKGNAGFDAFLADGVWKWIKPEPMIDSNWSDDGNGNDRYPDSLLDFNFVAGPAKDWKAECRVIVRDGDFPDDEKTSDHRPVELIIEN